jgi:hypothetical protein
MTARIAIISLFLFAGVLVCVAACSSTTPRSAGGGVDGGPDGPDASCQVPIPIGCTPIARSPARATRSPLSVPRVTTLRSRTQP